MSDLATLGIAVDSSGLEKGIAALNQVTAAAGNAAGAADKLEGAFSGATHALSDPSGFKRAAEAMKLTSFEMRNLTFQANDVATMMMMGASPFQILASQGGQIFQIFQTSQGGLKGFASGMMALATPTNLVVAGLLAAGAGAAYLALSTGDATDAIEKHAERTKALKAAYDDLVKGQSAVTKSSVAVQEALYNASKANLEREFKSVAKSVAKSIRANEHLKYEYDNSPFQGAIDALMQSVDSGTPKILRFREEIARMASDTGASDAIRKGALALLEFTDEAAKAEVGAYGVSNGIQRIGAVTVEQIGAINAFNASLSKLASFSPDIARSIDAGKKIYTVQDEYKNARDALKAEMSSGAIGGMEYSIKLDAINKAYDTSIKSISGVTQAQEKLNDQIDAAKARLSDTSLGSRLGAINAAYEKEVGEIRKKALMGASTEQIDGLIAQAKTLRDTNAQIARQEDARKGGGGKSDAEKFDDIVTQAENKLAMSRMELQAVGLGAQEVARMRTEQEMLNQAKTKDIELTPLQIAKIRALAAERSQADYMTEKARKEMESAKDVTKGFISTLRQGLMSGKSGFEALGDAALSVINKIADKIETQLVDALFSMNSTTGSMNPFGSILKTLFGFGFAGGGYTGNIGSGSVAGVVHGNEYVFSAPATKALGVGFLDSLHGAARGYSSGGYVAPAIPAARTSSSSTTTMFAPSITVQSIASGDASADRVAADQTAKSVRDAMHAAAADFFRQQSRPGGMVRGALTA